MLECMEKYKNKFAVEFAKIMEVELKNWQKVQNKYRLEYVIYECLMGCILVFYLVYMPKQGFELFSFICGFYLEPVLECLSKSTDRYERSRKNDCKREDTASSSRGGSVPHDKICQKRSRHKLG